MPEVTAALTMYLRVLAAVLGLCMGSFLNCFAYRYAKQESIVQGRSRCALCGRSLSAVDLLPVLSWILLRGRCRRCGGAISPRYLLAEILCALAYVSVLLRYDPLAEPLNTLKFLILASLLFAAAFSDLHCGLIPDRLTLIGAGAAFGFAFLPPAGTSIPAALLWTLINGLSVSLPLFLLVLLFDHIAKKETMGGGDIKMMFLIGLFFDWKLNLLVLILACVLALVYALIMRPSGEKHGSAGAFSFGPALALSSWAVMLWGDRAVDWYLRFFMLG